MHICHPTLMSYQVLEYCANISHYLRCETFANIVSYNCCFNMKIIHYTSPSTFSGDLPSTSQPRPPPSLTRKRPRKRLRPQKIPQDTPESSERLMTSLSNPANLSESQHFEEGSLPNPERPAKRIRLRNLSSLIYKDEALDLRTGPKGPPTPPPPPRHRGLCAAASVRYTEIHCWLRFA